VKKVELVTADINLASFCLALGSHLESLQQIAPGKVEITLTNVPEEAETALLNDMKVGARTLFSAQLAIRTGITAAMRRARA